MVVILIYVSLGSVPRLEMAEMAMFRVCKMGGSTVGRSHEFSMLGLYSDRRPRQKWRGGYSNEASLPAENGYAAPPLKIFAWGPRYKYNYS